MPDYIQLLESKLSPNEKQALNAMTDVARARKITVFLTGGAVRDIVSGASIRDLDITVQANPLKFKKDLERAGFSITGQHEPSQTLYLRFGKQARLEISAARTENFPKPARPEYASATILDDLHRRDFTANAMALSLNEGSWGLLLDPLNGTADISMRHLRLVSNYGFLEDPIRMIRAIRLLSRTGWEMEERTKTRYDYAKAEGVISAITAVQRGYELEEIAYEEEPLQVMKALETEGWMEHLSPVWTSRSADVAGLDRLHEKFVQLLMAGLQPDPSAAQFRLLTAKLSPSQFSSLKKLFVRGDLVAEAGALDADAKQVLQKMTAKDAAKPSQLWKLLHHAKPEAVLWLFFTNKSAAVQHKFENFFSKWQEARQKIPNAILQDMRIVPSVEGYEELLDKLTFAFMDGELPTEESVRKFAEPYSPPAPPPPVIVRRGRAVKRATEPRGSKTKGRKTAKNAATSDVEGVSLAASDSAATSAPAATGKTAAAGITKAITEKSASGKASAKAVKTAVTQTKPSHKPAGASKAQEAPAKGKPGKSKSEKSKSAGAAKGSSKSSNATTKSSSRQGKSQKAAVVAKAHSKANKKTPHDVSQRSAGSAGKKSGQSFKNSRSTAKPPAKASAATSHRPKSAAKSTAKKSVVASAKKAQKGSRTAVKSAATSRSKPKKKSAR